jgi:tRNA acetyltransferase TAN1
MLLISILLLKIYPKFEIFKNYIIIHEHNSNKGGGLIKPTEIFNLLVTLKGQKDENSGEEVVGTEEIEMSLIDNEKVLNIKDSKFPNVILIELNMEPLDAVKILENSQTTVISKVVPIETVVRTRMDSILEKVNDLAGDKVTSGDTFKIICDLRGRKYLKSKDELVERISEELIEKFNLKSNGPDSDWAVQIEVVGENTGISILNPEMILKKI